MAFSVGTQCASGTALSATSLDLVLNQDVPQSDPTNGQVILIGVTQKASTIQGFTISDNGTTPGTGYSGQPNQDSSSVFGAATSGGHDGPGDFWFSSGIFSYAIFAPLFTGDIITLTFTGTIEYLQASLFPASQAVVGDCSLGSNFVTGGSNSWTGTGGSLLITTSGGNIGLYPFAVWGVPGVTSMSFNDGAINTLDAWLNQGPDSDCSFMFGWRDIPGAGTYDASGSITGATVPVSGPGDGGDGGSFYEAGTGIAYCVVPAAGDPVFNNRTRLSV